MRLGRRVSINMSATPEPPPPAVVAEWLTPFLDYLGNERRYSGYTLRNYRQAFEDFWRWLGRRNRLM